VASVNHQPAVVRNDRRGNFIVAGLLFPMTFATPTCRLMERARFLQGDPRAEVSLNPPSHLNCSSIARRVLVLLLRGQANRAGRIQGASSSDSRGQFE